MRRDRGAATRVQQRRGWTAAVLAAVTGPMALLAATVTGAPAAEAVDGDGASPFASYNIDGTDNGTAWLSDVARMATTHAVVAVQEAGSGPPGADYRPGGTGQVIDLPRRRRPPSQPSNYSVVDWNIGTESRGLHRYVYFLQTDPQRDGASQTDRWNGGRTNLALVTDTEADEVRVLENPTYDPRPHAPNNRYRARPLFGLRFGNTWYWNVHARGEDVQGLLDRVRGAVGGLHWVMVGDFNVNILGQSDDRARDQSLHLHAGEELVRTGRPTYINARREDSELDYAITRGLPGRFAATIPRGGRADHTPVEFSRSPELEGRDTTSHAYSTELATPTGSALQENADHSFVLAPANFTDSQTSQMYTTPGLTHYLRFPGGCPSIAPGARRDTAVRIVAGPCSDPRAQWRIHQPAPDPGLNHDNSGPQLWQNVADPTLCLTAAGAAVTAAPCGQDASQRWWDNAVRVNTAWHELAANARLQSAWFDARIYRRGAVPGTSISSAPRPPSWWWIYWLTGQEKKDFGWTIEQAAPGDNLVHILSLDGEGRCLGTKDEHAGPDAVVPALLRACDDDRGVDAAGQRWIAETYADGTTRYRNEANHLCLLGPDGTSGDVRLASCNDIPAERWKTVNP
ncbi:endonuclease/exonuclease/phosphatase family protein [Amycolatopsis halotolerans]|uniref:Endonuclease/exonuclease/phosphatase family protein n=1 Tax=Amycolatopsis halotolerans TaxID=330083 RepID=A0ABV7QWW4_9PSEU